MTPEPESPGSLWKVEAFAEFRNDHTIRSAISQLESISTGALSSSLKRGAV